MHSINTMNRHKAKYTPNMTVPLRTRSLRRSLERVGVGSRSQNGSLIRVLYSYQIGKQQYTIAGQALQWKRPVSCLK